MDLDNAAAPEGAANEVVTPETENQVENQEAQLPEGEQPQTDEPVVEEVEYDFGGNKLKLPKGAVPDELHEQLDRFTKGTWADYTRKSQEVAEQRKSLEAAAAAVQKQRQWSDQALNSYARGLHLKERIAQIESALPQLWQQNPDEARKWSDTKTAMLHDLQRTVEETAEYEKQATLAEQQESARRAEEGRAIVNKAIKGFDTQVGEVIDYVVKTYGISKQDADTWPLNPPAAMMAWKAMQYDRMQAKLQAKPKPAPAKPVTAVAAKGGASVSSDPANMDMDQYAAWFEQRQKKAR